ncbi:hypothetical protein EGH24_07765 [Halonotius terrestris]|uniref:DUF8001 domain-containing protein n=1 Tax=Halonotius terrestris TaxID=2487750 RepID=A0A8J8TBK5_9EURY|nr:hypothetical protein [Halonotius terrestris]TQQ81037.1 hypothetical protein EGH24_07765 [Halonotius terrestris]
MDSPLQLDSGELTADEILAELRDGRRILVSVELLGSSKEISLRYDGETYYCDTPTQLHKHSDEEGMRDCITEMGYASQSP